MLCQPGKSSPGLKAKQPLSGWGGGGLREGISKRSRYTFYEGGGSAAMSNVAAVLGVRRSKATSPGWGWGWGGREGEGIR